MDVDTQFTYDGQDHPIVFWDEDEEGPGEGGGVWGGKSPGDADELAEKKPAEKSAKKKPAKKMPAKKSPIKEWAKEKIKKLESQEEKKTPAKKKPAEKPAFHDPWTSRNGKEYVTPPRCSAHVGFVEALCALCVTSMVQTGSVNNL